jgi:hypothetical protein
MPASWPSICIPRAFSNISYKRVAKVFDLLELGTLDHIDMVERVDTNGKKFQRIFVHFTAWSSSPEASAVRTRLLEGKEVKIVYDDPWFWKLSANRSSNARTNIPRRDNSSVVPNRGPRLIDEDSSSSDNDDKLVSRKQQQQSNRYHGNKPVKKVSESTATATTTAQDIDKPRDGSRSTVNYGDCKPLLRKKKHNKGTPVLVEESKKSDAV